MSAAGASRLTAMAGIAVAAAMALWWVGRTRLALDDGSDASRVAADALQALWLVRGMAVATLSVRVGASHGWKPGAMAALGLIAPSWPLLVLAWSASTMPLTHLILAEGLLLAAGLALPLIGLGLRRALPTAQCIEAIGTAIGSALAASWWLSSGWSALPPT